VELNYANYLRLPELLDLQTLRSQPPEHDEMLFITIHQVTELWLHQLLHELDKTCRDLHVANVSSATATLTRVRRILKVLIEQMDVLETMTPLSFSAFRSRLQHASGFQSMQFRELEIVLGHKRPDLLDHYPAELPGLDKARARLREPSVNDCLYDTLERRGVAIPPHLRTRDAAAPTEPDEAVQDAIVSLYVSDGEMRVLFELLTDVDEGVQEWRYRHVKMVERTIGNKPGTGGSSGVAYLKSTLFAPAFPDLWAMRHRL
jgi:tryptophan 2,3-dioxygenase